MRSCRGRGFSVPIDQGALLITRTASYHCIPCNELIVLYLQRCGVEATVLEARDRVGGRVHSYRGSGFSVPIDLGASLITGTATDIAKGLRPDPSAVVAR